MNLEREKLKIIQWVTTITDGTSIERLKMLRKNPVKSDWWEHIADEEKTSIDKGIADQKAGRTKSHKDARKIYEKWL